jgi:tetratricopeptide (TPR) repeat protein
MVTRRHSLRFLVCATLLAPLMLGATSARATTIDVSAKADFDLGRWRQAADTASRLHDADNLAFAARSLLASALLSPSSRTRTSDIAQARQFAEAALITDARHIEARLQLATALGLQARTGSPTRAFAAGLPQRVKRLLESVSRDAPTQAWTYALLGGWHLEGLRIGGAAARTMLGVDLLKGKTEFARAMRLDPNEAATPFYFAASLLALNPAANVAEARALLLRSQSAPNKDAFQNEVKSRAGQLIQSIDSQGGAVAARMALAWL